MTQVADGANPYPTTGGANTCMVRSYRFDNNGNWIGLTAVVHPDGDCASSTGTTTSTIMYGYDSADRATTGGNGWGAYGDDSAGSDPSCSSDDMTVSDGGAGKAHTVSQDGATITDMRDLTGRVMQVSMTGATTATRVNHSTDNSDSPTWVDTTTGSGPGTTVTSRYSDCISGDLGARILADGSALIPLSTPHGDVVTTVPVGATQTSATPSASCSGWVDYSEYGLPNNPTTRGTVGGDRGYGWLGVKHRSTTTVFSAGLTVMGGWLYDPVRGAFTSLDPTPGRQHHRLRLPPRPHQRT